MKSSTYDKNTLTSIHRMPSNVGSQAHSEENLSSKARVDPKVDKSPTNGDTLRGMQMPSSNRRLNGGTRVRLSHHKIAPGASLGYRIALMCIVLTTLCSAAQEKPLSKIQQKMRELMNKGVGAGGPRNTASRVDRIAPITIQSGVARKREMFNQKMKQSTRPKPSEHKDTRRPGSSKSTKYLREKFDEMNRSRGVATAGPKQYTGRRWTASTQEENRNKTVVINGDAPNGLLITPTKLSVDETAFLMLDPSKPRLLYRCKITEIMESEDSETYTISYIHQKWFDAATGRHPDECALIAQRKQALQDSLSQAFPLDRFRIETDDAELIRKSELQQVQMEAQMSAEKKRNATRILEERVSKLALRRAGPNYAVHVPPEVLIARAEAMKEAHTDTNLTFEEMKEAFDQFYDENEDTLKYNNHSKEFQYDISFKPDRYMTEEERQAKEEEKRAERDQHYEKKKVFLNNFLRFAEDHPTCDAVALSGNFLATIPGMLQVVTQYFTEHPESSITRLDLGCNKIRSDHDLRIMLESNRTLQNLSLMGNDVSGRKFYRSFVNALSSNKESHMINLSLDFELDGVMRNTDVQLGETGKYSNLQKIENKNKKKLKQRKRDDLKRFREADCPGLGRLVPRYKLRNLEELNNKYSPQYRGDFYKWCSEQMIKGYPVRYLARVIEAKENRITPEALEDFLALKKDTRVSFHFGKYYEAEINKLVQQGESTEKANASDLYYSQPKYRADDPVEFEGDNTGKWHVQEAYDALEEVILQNSDGDTRPDIKFESIRKIVPRDDTTNVATVCEADGNSIVIEFEHGDKLQLPTKFETDYLTRIVFLDARNDEDEKAGGDSSKAEGSVEGGASSEPAAGNEC